jgi:hypothetical protein
MDIQEQLKEKRTFEALPTGSVYKLPIYKVVQNVGIQKTDRKLLVPFVRGSKIENENEVFSIDGILHESLLAMQIFDLEHKYKSLPSEHTLQAISHLMKALEALEARAATRITEGTIGTYQQ